MSLDVKQFREFVVHPALQGVGLWSEAAEELVTGTAMVESTLNYVKQVGGGPAVGVCQIEPATYFDLSRRAEIKSDFSEKICSYLCLQHLPHNADYLMGNMSASVIFCRLKYYFHPDALPEAHDYTAMAKYWGMVYNTRNDSAGVERAVKIFKSVVLGYVYHG